MKSLSRHDLDALMAILLRIKGAHAITLRAASLSPEERSRLLDELGVIDRLMPKLATARLDAKDSLQR
jgi:hypothetical protein